MHSLMMLFALAIACGIRFSIPPTSQKNWARSLFFFLFPPLILLMTSLAVLCMGYRGEMLGLKASWFSYFFAIIFLFFASFRLIQMFSQAWLAQQEIQKYPQKLVVAQLARIIDTEFPYSARIGFWNSELIITQGLIDLLEPEHLNAVLAHEKAHYNYRDTFWFFWLEWLRSITSWLPNTKTLWQELLFLREIRADQRASKSVDSLLLAESLLQVAQQVNLVSPFNFRERICVAFHEVSAQNRLLERVNLILDEPESSSFEFSWYHWTILLCSLMPFFTLPLHD
ncbi:Zn-dependent protease with chaperone function [Aphanothece hegewaldii CCALA 016]|uniref:Zn-dependent protease with chaperone function n=1 Tax=Aphanothece hegewaldii CCALA 016 TaxID=2107694 RepID=A0A2T1LZM1_9CHRO|nr:M56 family metallopeptidase [Aphanothece hegewaldii]PSF37820.1 Zn-dependent protease with chaperone function [Aphanothece hegewaldii CCALA 016]